MREATCWFFPSVFMFLLSFHFQAALDEATEPWGIKVERVEM